ncbi:MAG: hypothetical protein ACLPYY_09100 [Acidimicrobiales bacterium]
MSDGDEWSPDEALGTETFRQGDVAEDEGERLSGSFLEDLELDPALDPALVADELELEELGSQLDDPELIVTLEGGMDDPDGVDPSARPHRQEGAEGWNLSAPLVAGDTEGEDDDEEDEDELA